MNRKEQYVAAIDIGTTKIVAIVGRQNENGKIEILGLSKAPSKGVKRGVVQNIEETVSAIRTTVEDVQKRSGIMFSDVFVGIAGQHIKSMKNRGYIMRDAFEDEIKKEEAVKPFTMMNHSTSGVMMLKLEVQNPWKRFSCVMIMTELSPISPVLPVYSSVQSKISLTYWMVNMPAMIPGSKNNQSWYMILVWEAGYLIPI